MKPKVFDWSRLGDVKEGRENLGEEMPVAVYRLMQYTLADELAERYGAETADEIVRSAGFRAGIAFARNVMEPTDDLKAMVADLQNKLKTYKIGILRMEKADLENFEIILTVSEDLDCSGLPVMDDTVCVYDEGFIGGILFNYTGKLFSVQEVDCWATGDRTCRFEAKVVEK